MGFLFLQEQFSDYSIFIQFYGLIFSRRLTFNFKIHYLKRPSAFTKKAKRSFDFSIVGSGFSY